MSEAGYLMPLPFRGGEEPRSGGGVGPVSIALRQTDTPHPNPPTNAIVRGDNCGGPEGEGL